MNELECKKHVREILSKADYKFDKKIKDIFWTSFSNEQASGAMVGEKCYNAIVKVIRDSIEKTSGIDSVAENSIKDILTIWNESMPEDNKYDATDALSKIQKVELKIKSKAKENYLTSCLKNIETTIADIEQSMIVNNTDEKIKIDMLLDIKNNLNDNVLCTNTIEAGECYVEIVECLKLIRVSVNTKTLLRRDVITRLKEAVNKWISLTKGSKSIFKKPKASMVDFTNDDLTFNVKYQEEQGYFEQLIEVLDQKIENQEGPMEDALKQEADLNKKLAILKEKFVKKEISKEQFARVAKPVADDLKMAQNRIQKISVATSSNLKNVKMIRNRLYDLYKLADSSSFSTKEKYDLLHAIDPESVMKGLNLNDDSIKFFMVLKKMETQLTERINYSNSLYKTFITPHMVDITPEDLDDNLDLEDTESVDDLVNELMNTETMPLEEPEEEKQDEMSDEELKKLFNI